MLASHGGFSRILNLHGLMSLSQNIFLLTDHLELIHHPRGSVSLMDGKHITMLPPGTLSIMVAVKSWHDIWIPYHNNI